MEDPEDQDLVSTEPCRAGALTTDLPRWWLQGEPGGPLLSSACLLCPSRAELFGVPAVDGELTVLVPGRLTPSVVSIREMRSLVPDADKRTARAALKMHKEDVLLNRQAAHFHGVAVVYAPVLRPASALVPNSAGAADVIVRRPLLAAPDLHAGGQCDLHVGIHSAIARSENNPLHLMVTQGLLERRGMSEQEVWQRAMQTLEGQVTITRGFARRACHGSKYHLMLHKEGRALRARLADNDLVMQAAAILVPRALQEMARALTCKVCQLVLVPVNDKHLLAAPSTDLRGILLMHEMVAEIMADAVREGYSLSTIISADPLLVVTTQPRVTLRPYPQKGEQLAFFTKNPACKREALCPWPQTRRSGQRFARRKRKMAAHVTVFMTKRPENQADLHGDLQPVLWRVILLVVSFTSARKNRNVGSMPLSFQAWCDLASEIFGVPAVDGRLYVPVPGQSGPSLIDIHDCQKNLPTADRRTAAAFFHMHKQDMMLNRHAAHFTSDAVVYAPVLRLASQFAPQNNPSADAVVRRPLMGAPALHAGGPSDMLVAIHSAIARSENNPLHLMVTQGLLSSRRMSEQQVWQLAMETLDEHVPQTITRGTARRGSGRGNRFHLTLHKDGPAMKVRLADNDLVTDAATILLPRALKEMARALDCKMVDDILKLAEREGRGNTTLTVDPFMVVTTHPRVTLRPYPQKGEQLPVLTKDTACKREALCPWPADQAQRKALLEMHEKYDGSDGLQ
ncbi:hypothetical protein WJX73_005107 [Symbiochloris irregularis]|uniref:Uncharacterized protein n=1 Tax=Symbiochloris irregularis TaxID=706552 RepID=A0AAW1PCI0_9CHLO